MIKKLNKGMVSVLVSLVVVFLGVGVYLFSKSLAAGADFAGGNIVDAKNVTDGNPSYIDPVSADSGDVVRIRIQVINLGDQAANNTVVKYDLSNPQSPKASVSADGAAEKNDYVNINPSGASLDFIEGSGMKYGPGCESGCAVSDDIVAGGINLGTVQTGDANSYQLRIEANVVGVPGGNTSGAEFRGGNIFDGGVTGVTWVDPVAANPGQVVEFRVTVINDGDETANNVVVRAAFPGSPSNPIVPQAYVLGEGVGEVSDSFTINVNGGSSQKLNYWEGHAFKWGPGCSSGCQIPDNVYVEGVNIGNVDPGVENSFQVVFKAYLTEAPTPTPTATPTETPTPTPTSTPTLTPTPTPTSTPSVTSTPTATPTETPIPSGTPNYCNGTCGSNYNCQGGLFCYQGYCRNPSCPSENSCGCPSGGTPPPVLGKTAPPSLPETGGGLEVILSLLGMGSAGVYAFKKFKLI